MADFFDSWREDSFDEANAPRFVDFNNLHNEDLGNRSAWFDSHESFYADATFLQSPKKTKRKASTKVKATKTSVATETRATTRRPKIKSASLARPLQPVRAEEEKVERKQRKRAASVLLASDQAPEVNEAGKGKVILSSEKENVANGAHIVTDFHPMLKKLPISPVPEAKKIESVDQLNRRLLKQIEERRKHRKPSVLPTLTTVLPAPAPSVAQAPTAELVQAPCTETPLEEANDDVESAEPAPLPVIRTVKPSTTAHSRAAVSTRAGQGRAVGKQVPVGKVLQQQRTNRLQNEVSKQRERAKAQREQLHKRTEKIDEAKKQRELEMEHRTKEKSEQMEQLRRQRGQEKEQRLREKERREAEERERKLARLEEKKHRKQLPFNKKQMLAEEFAIRSVKALTFPKEFHFATEARSRSNKEKHEEQAQTKPALPRVRRGAGLSSRTKPVSFRFNTEARSTRKRPNAAPAEDNTAHRDRASGRKRRRVEVVDTNAGTDAQQ